MKTNGEFKTAEQMFIMPTSDEEVIGLMEAYANQFKPKWISVSDVLPSIEGNYLIVCKGKVSERWYYIGKYVGFHINYGTTKEDITHWMEMPEPPLQALTTTDKNA